MTTFTSATPISMANSAALQALGSELHGWLIGIGLVNTTDTGQINWSTVTLPAANTLIGYEIWAFPDLSIYFKLQWTTGATATNAPLIAITAGTGSNGSGTITGQASTTNVNTSAAQTISSTTTNYSTYMCLTSDAFWIVWKAQCSNSSVSPALAFCIEKTVDSAGVDSSLGFLLSTSSATTALTTKQAIRTAATAVTLTASTSFCAVPGNITNSSNEAGSKQVFMHQYPIPDILLSNVTCTIVAADAAIGTSFTVTLVGTSSQTLISMGNQLGAANAASVTTTWSTALRWQ